MSIKPENAKKVKRLKENLMELEELLMLEQGFRVPFVLVKHLKAEIKELEE